MTLKPAFILAAAAVATGAAWAEGPIEVDVYTPASSTLSHADVVDEYALFKKGANPWSMSYDPIRASKSTLTRAEVMAQWLEAREQTRALTGEDSGSAYLAGAMSRDAQQ